MKLLIFVVLFLLLTGCISESTWNDDLDGDGVPNEYDNCPENPNGKQEDLDKDGIGDVCDQDRDGDGVLNNEDDYPNDKNESIFPEAYIWEEYAYTTGSNEKTAYVNFTVMNRGKEAPFDMKITIIEGEQSWAQEKTQLFEKMVKYNFVFEFPQVSTEECEYEIIVVPG